MKENYRKDDYTKDELLEIAIAENVLTQIENLKTYPVIRSRLFQGKLKIYAWIYLIETGEVLAYDPETHAYTSPHTQLPEYEPGEVPLPGYFTSTSAPPVACNLPASDSEVIDIRSQPVTTAHQGSGSSQEISNLWLSPEQADRIYRGRR